MRGVLLVCYYLQTVIVFDQLKFVDSFWQIDI